MYADYSPDIEILLTNRADGQLLVVIFVLVLRSIFNCGKEVGQDE